MGWCISSAPGRACCSDFGAAGRAIFSVPRRSYTDVRPAKQPACGRSSMVERQLPKLHTRVRIPSPAPNTCDHSPTVPQQCFKARQAVTSTGRAAGTAQAFLGGEAFQGGVVIGFDPRQHAGPGLRAFLVTRMRRARPSSAARVRAISPDRSRRLSTAVRFCRLSSRNSISSLTVMPRSRTAGRARAPSTAHCWVVVSIRRRSASRSYASGWTPDRAGKKSRLAISNRAAASCDGAGRRALAIICQAIASSEDIA